MTRRKNQTDETLLLPKGQDGKSATPKLPAGKKFSLVVVEGQNPGDEFPIEKWTVILGRDASVSDYVVNDPGASRSHACLELQGEVFVVEDLESTNGLSVNDKPTARQNLKNGDRITIGRTVLQFVVESEEKSSKIYKIEDLE